MRLLLGTPFPGARWEWLPFQISTALFPPETGQTARAGQFREGKRSPNFRVLACFRYLARQSFYNVLSSGYRYRGSYKGPGEAGWGGESLLGEVTLSCVLGETLLLLPLVF